MTLLNACENSSIRLTITKCFFFDYIFKILEKEGSGLSLSFYFCNHAPIITAKFY